MYLLVKATVWLASALFFAGFLVWLINKMLRRNCVSRRTMAGKTIIITGGNSGIGKETAIELATRGARVILACRSQARGQEALDEIKRLTGGDVILKLVDLCSLDSVRAFTKDILETEPRLDVLINNAGMGSGPEVVKTADGFEATFQANYLGHFLLTNSLLDLLKKSAPSRIVVVSSIMHRFGSNKRLLSCYSRDSTDVIVRKYAYSDSKLAQMHFVEELAKRLKDTGVTVNGLHPGFVQTNIFGRKRLLGLITFYGAYIFAKSSREGAQTTLHLSISDTVANTTGKYFAECSQAWTNPALRDEETRKRLWDISCQMTGL